MESTNGALSVVCIVVDWFVDLLLMWYVALLSVLYHQQVRNMEFEKNGGPGTPATIEEDKLTPDGSKTGQALDLKVGVY